MGNPGDRRYRLTSSDIRHYFNLSSDHHRVEILFRGHQHLYQHLFDESNRVIMTTLPVGSDSCESYQRNFHGQPDRAYILKLAPTVAGWTKQAILRASRTATQEVTSPVSLISGEI